MFAVPEEDPDGTRGMGTLLIWNLSVPGIHFLGFESKNPFPCPRRATRFSSNFQASTVPQKWRILPRTNGFDIRSHPLVRNCGTVAFGLLYGVSRIL